MSKKIKNLIIVLFVVLIASFIAGHYMAKNSEPYAFATDYIKENSLILNEIGQIQSLDLAFIGYTVKYSGPNGKASFNIKIIGTSGSSGDVYIDMVKETGVWQVKRANLIKLDGQIIKLN